MPLRDYLSIPAEDLAKTSKIHLEILPDSAALYQHFAQDIADQIKANNAVGKPTRLILPVGPVGQYPLLAEITNRERISWGHVHTFNMDEHLDWQGRPVPLDHPMCFAGYMQRHLFDLLDPALRIPANNIHFPDPYHIDAISEHIKEVGGIDSCCGGIGYHGHLAFNEPPISRWYQLTIEEFRNSLTRIVPLAPETIVLNSFRGTSGDPEGIPPMAVTLGMKDILSARRLRLYCDGGEWQRSIMRTALFAEPHVDFPVTLAQDHPDVMIICDQHTAQPVSSTITG